MSYNIRNYNLDLAMVIIEVLMVVNCTHVNGQGNDDAATLTVKKPPFFFFNKAAVSRTD